MVPGIFQLALRSVSYNRKAVLYQILITGLLSAVITGSLLTGFSVRKSLRLSGEERLGNTGILISSGSRYFSQNVVAKIADTYSSTGLVEIGGYSQNLGSQKSALNTNIWFVDKNFFRFHGDSTITISKGEVAINEKLSADLGLIQGDDITVRFRNISDIPGDSPFAPEKGSESSAVFKVGVILSAKETGNFSLSINQITPLNVFINMSDIEGLSDTGDKINRMLISKNSSNSAVEIYEKLKKVLSPDDIGLKIRKIPQTGGFEMISDRVFIDETILGETKKTIPQAVPVITYLANRFTSGNYTTPYSFISGLPSSLYPVSSQENGIVVNKWLANDLHVEKGDSIELYWYSPDSLSNLKEVSSQFIIKRIEEAAGIWGDSLLMPEFPGIAGSESCSDWDAGVAIKLDNIRDKDEEYWNLHRGTPKAFISYETGKKLWGNNFGPATAVRFPENFSDKEIETRLSGNIDPDKSGFTVRDISGEAIKAASESVDFGTLFLSLGFFLIISALVLLSFVASSYFDSKINQLKTLFSVGFSNTLITKILMAESLLVTMAGSIAGLAGGLIVSYIITAALNSVWRGAVQTDTLGSFYGFIPLLTGLLSTFIIVMILLYVMTKKHLKKLNLKQHEQIKIPDRLKSRNILLVSLVFSIGLLLSGLYFKEAESSLSFASGTTVLISFVLFWRYFFITSGGREMTLRTTSKKYFAFHPSQGITPILFIASGIFAVFITEANRMNFNEKQLGRSGGTGGYMIWAETRIPVNEDLNSVDGKKSNGFDDIQFKNIRIVQAKRSAGDDASCLNLNHVTAPPLLGIDPDEFINRGSFSFSKSLPGEQNINAWTYLNMTSKNNTIYGIADQTVLQWGLKIKTGDTLIIRSENGQPLNIIIAAGLETSVFQGHILISAKNFSKYYPSVSGSSVFLIDGEQSLATTYKNAFDQNFESYGVRTEMTSDRLSSFYQVTNTYLSVFSFFGLLGMVTGVAGLGFVLLRNYSRRKREFALLLALGVPVSGIKRMVFSEQVQILFAGVLAGVVSAIFATLPSLIKSPAIPWKFLLIMILAIIATGVLSLLISIKSITDGSLINSIKSE